MISALLPETSFAVPSLSLELLAINVSAPTFNCCVPPTRVSAPSASLETPAPNAAAPSASCPIPPFNSFVPSTSAPAPAFKSSLLPHKSLLPCASSITLFDNFSDTSEKFFKGSTVLDKVDAALLNVCAPSLAVCAPSFNVSILSAASLRAVLFFNPLVTCCKPL